MKIKIQNENDAHAVHGSKATRPVPNTNSSIKNHNTFLQFSNYAYQACTKCAQILLENKNYASRKVLHKLEIS